MILMASECALGSMPKNSMEGFRECIDLGVGAIEFDVHLASDGSVRVHHDYGIADQLGRPTLDDFIEYHRANDSRSELWIELKTTPFQRSISSDRDRLLSAVLDAIQEAKLVGLTMLLGFEWDVLLDARQSCATIRTDFLTIDHRYIEWLHRDLGSIDPSVLYGRFQPADYGNSIVHAIAAAGGNWWGPFAAGLAAGQTEQAHKLGLLVGPWGTTRSDLKRFADESIDPDMGPFDPPTI